MDVSSYITAVAVSPTGAYMAFGDADGTLHTLTSTSEDDHVPFNGSHGRPVEWADAPEPLSEIAWDDKTYANQTIDLVLAFKADPRLKVL